MTNSLQFTENMRFTCSADHDTLVLREAMEIAVAIVAQLTKEHRKNKGKCKLKFLDKKQRQMTDQRVV